MSNVALRLRGNIIPVGKLWGFEIFITIGAIEPIAVRFDREPHVVLTRESALVEMKKAAADLLELISANFGEKCESVIDLNKGESYGLSELRNASMERFAQ